MEIQCPNCSSRFNLPDAVAKPGVKLRCSVCKKVFTNTPEPEVNVPTPQPPQVPVKSKRRYIFMALAILVACALAAGAGFFFMGGVPEESPKTEQEIAKRVALLTMDDVRQYYIDNEKVGKVFVIEGKVINEFPQPKELITIEAAIYDKDKKTLALKKQMCGVQLSLFQLQVLSEKEMEAFLNNKIEILTNNANIPHGGKVPFMVLFYAPPDSVAEFGVRIIDAKDVPAQATSKE